MFQGLRTIVYNVADLQAAKGWYTTALGVAPYFDEPFYVGFNVGGYELGLVPADDSSTVPGSVTYWGVADADEAMRHLVAHGANEHEATHDVGGGIRLGSVYDPDGNIVGVIYNPHFALADTP
ncbi:MAG: VOC family protein [Fibrella sp.]|nr:VOC family protein [Armatimonadota bacterium]